METNIVDFYDILGINKNANEKEIKNAYKKLVRRYHPDKNNSSDASDKFRKIQIAYETLIDVEKRKKYDSFDSFKNNNKIKNLFMYYQELLTEICEKYEIDENDRKEILDLFDPEDIDNNLEASQDDIHKKLADKIFSFIPKFMLKKMLEKHPYFASALNYLNSAFGLICDS